VLFASLFQVASAGFRFMVDVGSVIAGHAFRAKFLLRALAFQAMLVPEPKPQSVASKSRVSRQHAGRKIRKFGSTPKIRKTCRNTYVTLSYPADSRS